MASTGMTGSTRAIGSFFTRVLPLAGTLLVLGHGAQAESLLDDAPLILKDGRIAFVSVRNLDFAPGSSDIDPDAEAELAAFAQDVATDCFLTAQVIGHADPNEASSEDRMASHRLARERADQIQAYLGDHGLTQADIANVWDWQFLIPEPRATVWAFRLIAGEDCDGTPLSGNAIAREDAAPSADSDAPTDMASGDDPADAVPALDGDTTTSRETLSAEAQEDAPSDAAAAPDAQAAADQALAEAAQDTEETEEIVIAGAEAQSNATDDAEQALSASEAEDIAETAAAEAEAIDDTASESSAAALIARETEAETSFTPGEIVRPAEIEPAAGPSRDDESSAAEAQPAPTPLPRTEVAELPPPPAAAETSDATDAAEAEESATAAPAPQEKPAQTAALSTGESELDLVFETNSSWFNTSIVEQLKAWVPNAPAGAPIVLEAAVGVGDVQGVESAEEAIQYNRWLAERRAERVRNWLQENAPQLGQIEVRYRENDTSRAVRVIPGEVG